VSLFADESPARGRRDIDAPGQAQIECRHDDIAGKRAGRYLESERLRCLRIRVRRDGSDVGFRLSKLRSQGQHEAQQSGNDDHQAEPAGKLAVLAHAAAGDAPLERVADFLGRPLHPWQTTAAG
jgi:hypothetical protein